MSTQVQFRRGNSTQTGTFTGAEGEVTINTTSKAAVVHDGVTAGGFEVARTDLVNVDNTTFLAKATAAGVTGGGGAGAITATISAITQANPGVVTTTTAHEFSNGQLVTFTDVGGMTQLNGEAHFCDVLTSTTFALFTDPALTVSLNTTGFGAYTSGGTVVATTAPGAPVTSSYVVISADPVLANERILTAGSGIVLADGGAGGGATLLANLANTPPNNLGSAAAGIANSMSRSDHVHAMPTAQDVGAVPVARNIIAGTGLSGGGALSSNVTLNLNAGLGTLTDVTLGSVINGDVLVFNNATSQFENSQNLPRITTQSANANVGTVNAVKTLNFAGDAVTTGQVLITADTDPTKVNISIPEIFTGTRVRDIVGNMVTGSTQTGIAVSYDSPGGKINFATNNFSIALSGDVAGSATVSNLGNVTITTQISNDAIELGTNTTGNYVQQVSVAGSGLTVSPGTAGEGSNVVVTLASAATNSPNTVVLRNANGNFSAGTVTASLTGLASLNLPLAGGTLTGLLTLSGAPTANLHAATKSYVDSSISSAGFTLNTSADSGSGSVPSGSALRITGGTGVSTVASANTITINNNGVTTLSAGPGVSLSAATGAVTISATGTVAGVSAVNSQTGSVTIQGTTNEIEIDTPASGIIRIGIPNNLTTTTLSTGSVTASGNITGNNLIATAAVSAATVVATTAVSTASVAKTGLNGVGNIGQSTNAFNTVFARATSAQYADLAESYLADTDYEPGTVVCFGGKFEVTVTDLDSDTAVAGIVSTAPAYEMNAALTGDHVCKVGLTGRLPCRVKGPVRKGSLLVSAGGGYARAEIAPRPGTIVGKSLQNFDGESGTIEVVVGRF